MRAMHRAGDGDIPQHQAHHSKPVLPRTIYAVTVLMSNGNCQKYVLARLNEVFVVYLLRALVKALRRFHKVCGANSSTPALKYSP